MGTVVELRDSPLSNTTRRGKYPVVEYTPRAGLPRRCEGGALLLTLHARRRSRERLRAAGTATLGTVIRAATSSVEEWGQTVQVLTLRALDPANGEQRELQSHRVPGKGDEWLAKQLTIYVDPRQPRRYLVDAPAPGR